MRYLIEFLVPALVVIVLATLVLRNRGSAQQPPGAQPVRKGEPEPQRLLSTGAFVTILVVAAAFTVALVYELGNLHH